eukprot:scaffold153086_cov15-Tisochrysis_lutea.AAC.1
MRGSYYVRRHGWRLTAELQESCCLTSTVDKVKPMTIVALLQPYCAKRCDLSWHTTSFTQSLHAVYKTYLEPDGGLAAASPPEEDVRCFAGLEAPQ